MDQGFATRSAWPEIDIFAGKLDVLLTMRCGVNAHSHRYLALLNDVQPRCEAVYRTYFFLSLSRLDVFHIGSDRETERILYDHGAGFAMFAFRLSLGHRTGLLPHGTIYGLVARFLCASG